MNFPKEGMARRILYAYNASTDVVIKCIHYINSINSSNYFPTSACGDGQFGN